jgi:hypothetical protein
LSTRRATSTSTAAGVHDTPKTGVLIPVSRDPICENLTDRRRVDLTVVGNAHQSAQLMADAFRQSDCGARAHAKRSSCDDNARRHGHKHDRFSRRGISERSTGRASGPD